VTGLLAEGLTARGVDVTLFATLDSLTSAHLDGVCPRGYATDPAMDGRVWEALHVSHALARSAQFDLVHNHLDWLPLAFAEHCRAPMLTTVHGFSGPGIMPAYTRAMPGSFVSISDSDRRAGLDYVATVHHGVDVDELPFSADAGPGLVVLGRIHPDKGIHTAIEIARRAGRQLTICGIVQDQRYFAERVAPHVDGDRVVFAGAVGPQRRAEILGASAALLHPIDFEHPKVIEREGEAYRQGLHRLGGMLGVDHMVRYEADYQDPATLRALVASADVVVLPYDSREQVTSGVLIEAVAAGVPVVATAFPHAVELLTDGRGHIVPHQDPVALAAAIRRALSEPPPATRHLSGDRAASALRWPAVAERYETLARGLVTARSAAVNAESA
jgi:glycosyltransferase involved in cell wall biosynthesis